MTDNYTNRYQEGKSLADYDEPPCMPGARHRYIEDNRARLGPWSEYALPEIGKGKDLIREMPTELLWALQSRWFMDPEVGWKAKEIHWDKLIKFWLSKIPEEVVARHIGFVLPDATVERSEKKFAPCPGAHRSYVDNYDLKVTRNDVTKFYEVKSTKNTWSPISENHGPEPGLLWVAAKWQVQDKLANTEAWIWVNGNHQKMRVIKASTHDKWSIHNNTIYRPPEEWYAAPLELWDIKNIKR